jgi:pimeloyl-ACP methyl ester carboxylesterase
LTIVPANAAISANYDPSGLVPEALEVLTSMGPDSDDLATFRTWYQAASPDGVGHWPTAVAKFQAMVSAQPNITSEQLGRISVPTLLVAGDDDMITLAHHSSVQGEIERRAGDCSGDLARPDYGEGRTGEPPCDRLSAEGGRTDIHAV